MTHTSEISSVPACSRGGIRHVSGPMSIYTEPRTWVYPFLLTEKASISLIRQRQEALNRQFVSVFTEDNGNELPDKGPSSFHEMNHIHLTQPGIEKVFLSINPTKAAGPDEVTSRLQKETGHAISSVLAYIFQQ